MIYIVDLVSLHISHLLKSEMVNSDYRIVFNLMTIQESNGNQFVVEGGLWKSQIYTSEESMGTSIHLMSLSEVRMQDMPLMT